MSNFVLRFSVVLLITAAIARAEEPAAPKAENLPAYALKNKSTFSGASESSRAPFWPIGWVKRSKVPVTAAAQAPVAPVAQVKLDAQAFKVTSILIGAGNTPSLAIINGRTYSEGEFLRMPKNSPTPGVRVRVQRINDGTVILQNADQTLVASLARPELSNKKSEEQLLDPDR